MSIYVFRDIETDEVVEVDWDYDQLMNRQFAGRATINGRECRRDVKAEIRDDPTWVRAKSLAKIAKWPIESVALGVASSQAQDLRDELRRHGLGHVEVNSDGNPIITGPKMKRLVSKASGQKPLDEYTI